MMKLYNAVRMPPRQALRPIQAGRLKGKTDINPMWRIKALTEQFGPCGIGWKYVITKQWIEEGGNGELAAFTNIDLYIKADGEWSEAIPGTGGSSFVAKERSGLYTSDECFKMALTDAISVACKALGFAADIYWEADGSKYGHQANRTEIHANTQAPKQAPKPAPQQTLPATGNAPADIVLTFGKHEGERLGDIPAGYVRWLATNAKADWLREAAEKVAADHEAAKGGTEKEEMATDEQVAEIGFLLAELDATEREVAVLLKKFGIENWNELTATNATKLKAALESRLDRLSVAQTG